MDGDKLADVIAEELYKKKVGSKKANPVLIDDTVKKLNEEVDKRNRSGKHSKEAKAMGVNDGIQQDYQQYISEEKEGLKNAPSEFNSVKDSGMRTQFLTGAVRDCQTGKGFFHLISPIGLRRLAKHYENGAKKYGNRNWEKGVPLSSFLNSAIRHWICLCECLQDEDHAAALAWNAFGFMHTAEKIKLGKLPAELDDIGWLDGEPRLDSKGDNSGTK